MKNADSSTEPSIVKLHTKDREEKVEEKTGVNGGLWFDWRETGETETSSFISSMTCRSPAVPG